MVEWLTVFSEVLGRNVKEAADMPVHIKSYHGLMMLAVGSWLRMIDQMDVIKVEALCNYLTSQSRYLYEAYTDWNVRHVSEPARIQKVRDQLFVPSKLCYYLSQAVGMMGDNVTNGDWLAAVVVSCAVRDACGSWVADTVRLAYQQVCREAGGGKD